MESSYNILINFVTNNNVINKELISSYIGNFLENIDNFNFG